MLVPQQITHTPRPRRRRALGHLWTFFLPFYLVAVTTLDPIEVTNAEYLKFVRATRQAAPEHWHDGSFPKGGENDPVVLVNFHQAASYCRFVGRRLPSVDEWQSTCALGTLKKRGDIWEWTSTDVEVAGQTYKALCGPSNTCDCSHHYLPEWKNAVKGFRCSKDAPPVTWLPIFYAQEIWS
jgi:formylglycine-generating enzyme required for sulfatase activity